jgi:hypothetical protein
MAPLLPRSSAVQQGGAAHPSHLVGRLHRLPHTHTYHCAHTRTYAHHQNIWGEAGCSQCFLNGPRRVRVTQTFCRCCSMRSKCLVDWNVQPTCFTASSSTIQSVSGTTFPFMPALFLFEATCPGSFIAWAQRRRGATAAYPTVHRRMKQPNQRAHPTATTDYSHALPFSSRQDIFSNSPPLRRAVERPPVPSAVNRAIVGVGWQATPSSLGRY